MPTQIAPSAVQLSPAAQPEEKVQELANRHRKYKVRGQSFDFARLFVRSSSLTHSILLEHVQLRVDRHAFEVHRDRPEQIAVGPRAMGTNDQRQNDSRNDEVERSVLLGEEIALAERVVVRIVSVFQRTHNQIDVDNHSEERNQLHHLVEPITASGNERTEVDSPIEWQIAGAVPHSDESAQEDNGIALESLQRHSRDRPRLDGPEGNEAEAKAANQTSQSLTFNRLLRNYKEEGKIAIRKEVLAG